MNKIFLKDYSIKTPEVYSVLIWQINNTEHIFQIDYPSNPVLDIELMVLHKKPLEEVEDSSIYLEEYARGMIGEEEQHSLELKRMLKDYG